MSKPAPRRVKLPGDREIIPEHFHEGPEAQRLFQSAVQQIIGVSKDELQRREAVWRQKRSANKRHSKR